MTARSPDSASGDTRRAYDEAVRWLEGFIRPITGTAPQKTLGTWAHDGPDRLARMRALLAALGNPQQEFRTLHVAGTSGKGSVCTFLGAALRAAGLRTGVHTTPYLQIPVEKLQLDGRYASPAEFVALVERFRALLGLPAGYVAAAPSPFEGMAYPALWIALTYLFFAMQRAEVAVIEASAGGRYDWTNTLVPEVAVVTTVGSDHLLTLGPTLADIAYHKAGVVKQGTPVATGVALPEREAIEREAAAQGAPLRRLGVEFEVRVRRCDEAGTVFDYLDRADPAASLLEVETGMLGRYQAVNAGLAVAALRLYAERHGRPNEAAIRAGLRDARLAGRMELIQRDPDVVLDGAHNPQKSAALAGSLAEVFAGRRLVLVLGALSMKDAAGIIAPLIAQTRLAVVTAPHVLGKPAADPERMAADVRALGVPALVEAEPAAAVRRALAEAGANDVVCVTGSLYLVGEVRRLWVSDDAVLAAGRSG